MEAPTRLHLANGIPGAKEFIANNIYMAARPERIAAITENTVNRFPSFLRQHELDIEVNWIMYSKTLTDVQRRNKLTEILLAAGVLSLEEFQNLRICDTETQEEFLGPMLDGKRLFFNYLLPEIALQFKEGKTREISVAGRTSGVSIIQMTQRPLYALWEKCLITAST